MRVNTTERRASRRARRARRCGDRFVAAVSAIRRDRRPRRTDRQGRWPECLELGTRIDHVARNDCQHRFEMLDRVFVHREEVIGERDEVGELAHGQCSLLVVIARKPLKAGKYI